MWICKQECSTHSGQRGQEIPLDLQLAVNRLVKVKEKELRSHARVVCMQRLNAISVAPFTIPKSPLVLISASPLSLSRHRKEPSTRNEHGNRTSVTQINKGDLRHAEGPGC